jgi:hypothetical protein
MTLAQLNQLLKLAGFPVAYSHFVVEKNSVLSSMPTPPFITYLVPYSSNFIADNKVYHKIDNAQIELYTTKKDLVAENKLEKILDENEIPYETTETYIKTEQLFQKIYEVRLL